MGFPMAVALVVILGSLLVGWARTDREATSAPRVGDHWHSAYDIYVCDSYRSKVVLETDPNGIHSHGDGLLHIHPFNKLVAASTTRAWCSIPARSWSLVRTAAASRWCSRSPGSTPTTWNVIPKS